MIIKQLLLFFVYLRTAYIHINISNSQCGPICGYLNPELGAINRYDWPFYKPEKSPRFSGGETLKIFLKNHVLTVFKPRFMSVKDSWRNRTLSRGILASCFPSCASQKEHLSGTGPAANFGKSATGQSEQFTLMQWILLSHATPLAWT